MICLTLTKREQDLLKSGLQELDKRGGYGTAPNDLRIKLEQESKDEQTSLREQILKLEKALNKACDKLSTVIEIEGCNQFCEDAFDRCCDEHNCSISRWWKEWCMEGDVAE